MVTRQAEEPETIQSSRGRSRQDRNVQKTHQGPL